MVRNSKNLRNPFVTLIVGIICPEGIVMAADSQMTHPTASDTIRKFDSRKLHIVKFKCGRTGLIGQSGVVEWTESIIREIDSSASGTEIKDRYSFHDMADRAVHKWQLEYCKREGINQERLKEISASEPYSLMLAIIAPGKEGEEKIISIVGSRTVLPTQRPSKVWTSGAERVVAEYILSRFPEEMNRWQAMIAAGFTVAEMKRFNAADSIGGPIQMATIRTERSCPTVAATCPDEIRNEIDQVMSFDKKERTEWGQKMAYLIERMSPGFCSTGSIKSRRNHGKL